MTDLSNETVVAYTTAVNNVLEAIQTSRNNLSNAVGVVNAMLEDPGFTAVSGDLLLGAASKIAIAGADLALGANSFIKRAPQAAVDAITAAATVNASITPIIYDVGAPDAMTVGPSGLAAPNGATYIEATSARQYGPKKGGAWPSRYVQLGASGPVETVAAVFFMGQSNADGYATNDKTATALSPGYGYEYYYNYGGIGTVLPLGNVRLGRKEGGPQRAFAQTWAAGGGGAVVCVDCAAGGSSMSKLYTVGGVGTLPSGRTDLSSLGAGTWDLSEPTNLYVNYYRPHMQRALSEMQRQGYSAQRIIAYWSQGEQDALGNTTQATYDAAFRAFLRQLKIDFPSIICLIEALGTNQGSGGGAGTNEARSVLIRQAQIAVAADAEFSSWVKIGANLAKDFAAANKFSDTLHYNQQGYNELGVAMATTGLTFSGAGGTLPAPTGTKYADLLANMPPVTGWFRASLKTTRQGAWNISLFNGQNTPFSHTWYDLTGPNTTDAAQAVSWNFPDPGEKTTYLYLPANAGATLALNAFTGNVAMSAWRTIDEGFPLQQINIPLTEQVAGGAILNDASLYRFAVGKIRVLGIGSTAGATGNANGPSFTNVLLAKLNQLTDLHIGRSPQVAADLNLALVPALKAYGHDRSGLTVAQVNARLIALDANGVSNGSVSIAQYLASPPMAAAVPTGAGLTAKNNLIAKGWTVTTD